MDKGKGGQRTFFIYEVKEEHHAHKFVKKYPIEIMFLVQNEAYDVEP